MRRSHDGTSTVLVATLLAGVACAACTSSGVMSHPASATPTAPGGSGQLTPSIPGVFRTGTNACGNPYAINAATTRETVPLLDCPGLADAGAVPTVAVGVGGQVLISGVPKSSSLTYDHVRLRRSGDVFTTLRSGRAVITIHQYNCGPTGHFGTCPLVAVLSRG